MSFCKRKTKICLIFALSILILLGSLWWLNFQPTLEAFDFIDGNYLNEADQEFMREQTSIIDHLELSENPAIIDLIKIQAYDRDIIFNNRSIFVNDPTIVGKNPNSIGDDADYSLNQVTFDIMNKNPTPHLDWSKVSINKKKKKEDINIHLLKKIVAQPILSDACSKKSLLNSSFKDDICVKYVGNNVALNEKCQELSADNCKIPDCCVLVNGNKCVAGNANGPIFLTDDGESTDYSYYYHKSICYGDCIASTNLATACDNYASGSIGVSKECMLQMFNDYGCPNKSPDDLINDKMVQSYSKTSKRFVANYIKSAVNTLKQITNQESYKLCYGSLSESTSDSTSESTIDIISDNTSDSISDIISDSTSDSAIIIENPVSNI